MKTGRNPPLSQEDIRSFETRFGVILPDEYRQFLIRDGDGGAFGPRYGLLPLGTLPPHWSEVHDYSTRLRRPFPLEAAWVWEDEPEAPDLGRRMESVDDGVLLLGEEGCGARWILVVTGTRAGEVWLTTGEGIAPTSLTFRPWLERFSTDGEEWWASLVESWGPSPNIWFAAHAAKQIYVSEATTKTDIAFAQSSPLCFDCIKFFKLASAKTGGKVAIATPGLIWLFSADGTVKAIRRDETS
jgi:SMI1/KNR4 family protein SUKH-1